jgi:hypothetical protein
MRLDSTLGRGALRIVLGLAVAGLAAASMPAAGPEEAAVLAAQKERMQAMVRGDVEALSRLLPDDLTYTHASGVIDTKASLLSSIQSGKLKYKSDVYVKKGAGPWQAVAWQSTRPPAPPSPAP